MLARDWQSVTNRICPTLWLLCSSSLVHLGGGGASDTQSGLPRPFGAASVAFRFSGGFSVTLSSPFLVIMPQDLRVVSTASLDIFVHSLSVATSLCCRQSNPKPLTKCYSQLVIGPRLLCLVSSFCLFAALKDLVASHHTLDLIPLM